MADLEAEVSRLRDENEQVTAAYEELEEKYRPFLEQVDSLEDLNKLLQSQTSLAQSEAEKFGELYAKVLGHQNHKQKIQYVKKLRDENASLKQVCVSVCVCVWVSECIGCRCGCVWVASVGNVHLSH